MILELFFVIPKLMPGIYLERKYLIILVLRKGELFIPGYLIGVHDSCRKRMLLDAALLIKEKGT